jgi:hypothetical protein
VASVSHSHSQLFQKLTTDYTPDDANAAELVKISTGQLYLVRPGNIRTSRECMFVDLDVLVDEFP